MNNAPRHPGAQTMADFLDGTLPASEVATVAAHLRECGECRTVIGETARFEREDEARTRRSPLRSRAWWLAAAAIFAVAVIGIPLLRVQLARTSDPIARLIEAAPREHRLVEPRLAGFRWARLQSSARGTAAPDPADLKLAGAAGDVLEKTLDRRDPSDEHAKGVAYLLIGRTTESIAALEQSAEHAKDWRAWNDLAAARYALAIDGKTPSQLPEALASTDRALRLQPNAPETLFNRALILEALGLKEQARRAWKQYLAADPSSAWSNEAREHLRQLEQQNVERFDPKRLEVMPVDAAVRQFPYETRRYAELLFLAGWADAARSHEDAKAAALLAQAHAVGDALVRLRSEHLLAGSVAAIEGAGPSARTALIDGHRLYRDARSAFKRGKATEAEKPFRDSAILLARGGSPMAQVAEYYAATTAFNQHRAAEARQELTELLARVDGTRYHALRGEILRQLAVCANADGDWGSGARYANEAASLFRSLGERAYAADSDGIAAMAVEMIGESDRAWQQRIGVFAEISDGGEASRLSTNVQMAATTLAAIGHAAAAASMVRLLADEDALDPARASFSSADYARYAMRSGDPEAANQALARARASVQNVDDPQLRGWIDAQIDLAHATSAGDPRRAILALDRTIDYFTGKTQLDLPDAYLERARAKHASGDEDGSLDDYAAALHAVENQRATLPAGQWRLQFLDVATRIIEETIDRRLARGDVAGAFAVADRARMLIDPQPVDVASPGALPALPPGVVVIEYALLPRRIVAFCISNGGVAAESVEIDRGALEQRIAAFTERMRRRVPVDELRAESAAFYQLLIAPLQRHLLGARELVIVPDRQLYAVPFAALWNAAAKQYLVEELTLRFAPSASFRRDLARTTASPAALVIADPATSSPPLPASRKEASAIAAMYGTALLAGDEATRAAFVESARRSTLIHFAGHANSDAMLSHGALLLAASGGDSGILDSSEVARLRLERNPLVLLAACGTFRGDALHVAGMSSLSRAFLLAGARGVVGTLWEIDDDVSATLFLRVHEHLRAGLAPADALRAAQIDLLRSPDPRLSHLATWAPAELLTDV